MSTIPHKNIETNEKFYRKVAFLMYSKTCLKRTPAGPSQIVRFNQVSGLARNLLKFQQNHFPLIMGIIAYKKASLFIDKNIPDHKEIKFLTVYTISMINYIYTWTWVCFKQWILTCQNRKKKKTKLYIRESMFSSYIFENKSLIVFCFFESC